jgi:fructuronate reductase
VSWQGPPPPFDRGAHAPGIVHLGIGAFHRAHQAVYTHEALARHGGDWLIRGVSTRSDAVRTRLAAQDFLYTNWTRSTHRDEAQVIASLHSVLSTSQHGAAAIIRAIADPATRIVSLTITEKGYCANHAGTLDTEHPDVVADLNQPEPRTAIGYLVRGLAARKAGCGAPLTVLSCDNLAGNGALTGSVTRGLAAELAPDALPWIEDNVTFPATMVDRIVPAVTDADLAMFAARFGYRDAAPVIGEAWTQWVIEDDFAAGRPAWETAGAQLVEDVTPYEIAKLRLLNASHSACAYLGLLAGHTYVHEAIADPQIHAFVVALMAREVAPTLAALPDTDLASYRAAIIERFGNAEVPYRTAQVATDGSQKLPQRLLPVVAQRLAEGQPVALCAEVIGAWCACIERIGSLSDPMLERLRSAVAGGGAEGLLGVAPVFGELGQHAGFAAAVAKAYARHR